MLLLRSVGPARLGPSAHANRHRQQHSKQQANSPPFKQSSQRCNLLPRKFRVSRRSALCVAPERLALGAPEATRDRQTASKDALDVLVTGASLLTGTSSAVCGALATLAIVLRRRTAWLLRWMAL